MSNRETTDTGRLDLNNTASYAELHTLFEDNVDAVFTVARRIVGQSADAEDVTQSTFVKAMTRGDQVRDSDRIRAWLLTIAYHEAIAVLRKRRDEPHAPESLPDRRDHRPQPDEVVIAHEVQRIIADSIQRLPETLRAAVVLRDVEELPMSDVAAILGVGDSAAKMRVQRGREHLRTMLEGHQLRGL